MKHLIILLLIVMSIPFLMLFDLVMSIMSIAFVLTITALALFAILMYNKEDKKGRENVLR